MASRLCLVLLFLGLISVTLAASPTSFCKCTCFSDSTIIPLGDSKASANSDVIARTCNDCTKAFCLSYNLPICKNADEADVFAQCFQRDSRKDQIVVFIFIATTLGLLVWAAIKPWVEKWKTPGRTDYVPLATGTTR